MSPDTDSMVGFQEIVMIHFNDVYHLNKPEHIARFAAILACPSILFDDLPTSAQPLRIFSGDVFSPSLEASVLRGEHMVPVLNALDLDVACYGNHDFDFGEARLVELSKRTSVPWLLSNVVKPGSEGKISGVGDAKRFLIQALGDLRVGFFGLAGTDWPSNCQHLPSCEILSPVTVAREMAQYLRRDGRCDLVIALTHMRLAEDWQVSQATIDSKVRVDLILAGHDHDVVRRSSTDKNLDASIVQEGLENNSQPMSAYKGDVRIIKSGTNWRNLSLVRLKVVRTSKGIARVIDAKLTQIHDLAQHPAYPGIPPCTTMLSAIHEVQTQVEAKVEQPLWHTAVALEGRSQVVRSRESNLGNMLADAVQAFYQADIALVNAGAIRCDRVIGPNSKPLLMRDVIDINPFDNVFVVVRMSGANLWQAFENSVGDMHADGRFLHVAGMRVLADWRETEGLRIKKLTWLPQEGDPVDMELERKYAVATVDFIARGFDGYACFKGAEELVDNEGGMTDTNLLLQIFKGASKSDDENVIADETEMSIRRARKAVVHWTNSETNLPVVAPTLEGRIRFLGGDKRAHA